MDKAVDSILAAGTTGDITGAMLDAGGTVGFVLPAGEAGDAANSIPGWAEPGGGDVKIPGSAYPSDCPSRTSRTSSTSVAEPVSLISSGWIIGFSSSSILGLHSECS